MVVAFRLEPPAPAIPPVVTSKALPAFTVSLLKRITKDLLVLSLVSVGRAVAFGCVSPVARTLRVVTLSPLRVGCAYVQAVAVALLPRDLETVVAVTIVAPVSVVTIIAIAPVSIIVSAFIAPAILSLNVGAGDCCKTKNQEECQEITAHFLTRVMKFHFEPTSLWFALATAMPESRRPLFTQFRT